MFLEVAYIRLPLTDTREDVVIGLCAGSMVRRLLVLRNRRQGEGP